MSTVEKTVFITGSSGFIGRNIVHWLRDKYNILAPTHKELDLLSQDQVDGFFNDHKINYVIHCANIGGNRKASNVPNAVEKNSRMFFNLSRNESRYEKLIHFGSGAEYAKDRMPPNVKETDFGTYIPTDDYGFSKYLISRYIENTDRIYCLRLFGVFGPYEDYEYKFISNAIVKNLLHLPIRIMQNVYFDWMYVDDLVTVVEYFLRNDPVERVYNVTTGQTTDLVTIASLINEHSDFKSDILVEHGGLNREYSGYNARLMRELGDYSFMPMDMAIQKLMEYYQENLDNLNKMIIEKDPYASKCAVNVKT